MKCLPHYFLLIIAFFVSADVFAQKQKLSDYYLIQRQYEDRDENDSTALPLIRTLIKKAKKDKNDYQLFLGYTDARFHSPDPNTKIKYADSAIATAKRTKNDSLLSSAYLSKGIIYYFNFKKYKLALDDYLKAFKNNKACRDKYYINKINYHIGVVKSYIGYYDDALQDFSEAKNFFSVEIKKDMHPNKMRGILRGYYNTIHQMAVCYRNLNDFKKADSLVRIGLSGTLRNSFLKQEYSYFLKEQGINRFHQKDYTAAVKSLQDSLPNLINVNDFAWLTVCYSYLGKSHWKLGHIDDGLKEFEKVDSIFNKHDFVLPEVREVYEIMIDHYGTSGESSKALYYTKQLLKVDKVLEQDFIYLSSKIHRDYDTRKLLSDKEKLERIESIKMSVIVLLIIIALFGGFYWLIRYRSKRSVSDKNTFLGINFGRQIPYPVEEGTYRTRAYKKTELRAEIVEKILVGLSEFEKNKDYLQRKTMIGDLATKFGVTSKNITSVLQEHKQVSFNLYLTELRIRYITDKLKNDPKYLKYSSAALAKECGISSRPNFSRLFQEVNGITFSDFVNNLKDKQKNV